MVATPHPDGYERGPRQPLSGRDKSNAGNAVHVCDKRIAEDDNVWAELYKRLVPKKCAYDERKCDYVGKIKVIGRVARQMSSM